MGWPAHDKRYPYPCFNQEKPDLEKANYPFWMVFDETRRTNGSTIFGWSNAKANEGWMSVHGPYQWSDGCTPEIGAGYVLKADSIEELGGLMGYEGDDLQAFVDEIAAFNENGANGEDPEFGSVFYHYYSGGNFCECFTSGMKCGQNVSALEPWA